MNSLNARPILEINLTSEETISKKECINNNLYIGMELQNGERFFVSSLNSPEGIVYAILDPKNMSQYSANVYDSLDSLFTQLKEYSKEPVEKFKAFTFPNDLFNWASGIEIDAGLLIVFDDSKVDPDKLDDDSIIGFKIHGVCHMLLNAGNQTYILINSVENRVVDTLKGHVSHIVREVKKNGDVEGYVFLNTDIYHGWIQQEITGRYRNAITS